MTGGLVHVLLRVKQDPKKLESHAGMLTIIMIVIVNLERTSRGRMRRADESRDSLAASFEVRPRRISAAYVMDQRAAIRCGEEMLDFLASKSPVKESRQIPARDLSSTAPNPVVESE